MLKAERSSVSKIREVIAEFPGIFKSAGNILYCKCCNVRINHNQRGQILQHLLTSRHMENLDKANSDQQRLLAAQQGSTSQSQYGSTLSQNEVEIQRPQKIRYPKAVFFIISNEFCERFSYYGMRAILSIYLQNKLLYTETEATLIYHSFVMLCYFFPAFGAILADSFIGKYKTILYLSIVYAFGSITLSATSTGFGFLGQSERGFTLLGLVLVALGTGGIKPCVSSFGGDQFVVPQQEKQLQQFFSVFYFSINAGSLISTFLTPELRSGSCLGQNTCYPLAFGVPAVLMIVALGIFIAGKWMYKIKQPTGNIMVDVVKCSSYALTQKIKSSEKHDHWLDFAKNKYNAQLIEDTKIVMSLILLFSPTILFWALFEQQGTSWTFQATRMNGKVGSFIIKPDQMQVINPVLILLFIPLFECLIYPLLAKLRIIRTPLQKLTAGGLMVAVAFFVAAAVESKIQPTYEVLPKPGEAQLRIINGVNCTANVTFSNNGPQTDIIDRLGILQLTSLKVTGEKDLDAMVTVKSSECPFIKTDLQVLVLIKISEEESVSYLLNNENNDPTKLYLSRIEKYDTIKKKEDGKPQLRIVYEISKDSTLDLISDDETRSFKLSAQNYSTSITTVPSERYKLKLNEKDIAGNVDIEFAGVYTLFIKEVGNEVEHNLYTISPPNSVHILWQMPQIIILTAAEIMFSITGLEFSYSQAPQSMKSVMSSVWLLTDALGNLCVVIMAEVLESDSRVKQFMIYGVLMVLIMIVFSLLAMRYKYVNPKKDDGENEINDNQPPRAFKENPAFNSEE